MTCSATLFVVSVLGIKKSPILQLFYIFRALYNGIIPGLQRQMAFSAIRIGAYETVKQKYIQMTGVESQLGLVLVRIAAGVTTGTIAILSAQPTDVVKIRMQAELRKAGEAPRYSGVFKAYKHIFQVEGFQGLYKGTYYV